MIRSRTRLRLIAAPLIAASLALIPSLATTPAQAAVKASAVRISLTMSPKAPTETGPTMFRVVVRNSHGAAVGKAKVSISLVMTEMDMGTNIVTTTEKAPGAYVGTGTFTMGGSWMANVSVAGPGVAGKKSFPIQVK